MNTSLSWQAEYKTVVRGIEVKVRSQGDSAPWIWKAREILSNHTLATSKPYREIEAAIAEAERWLAEQQAK